MDLKRWGEEWSKSRFSWMQEQIDISSCLHIFRNPFVAGINDEGKFAICVYKRNQRLKKEVAQVDPKSK